MPVTTNEAIEYAAECKREADLVTVQSDNRFLVDLHRFRAELAALEVQRGYR